MMFFILLARLHLTVCYKTSSLYEFLIELVQKSSKDDQRDFLFYLAVANYRLKVRIMT